MLQLEILWLFTEILLMISYTSGLFLLDAVLVGYLLG